MPSRLFGVKPRRGVSTALTGSLSQPSSTISVFPALGSSARAVSAGGSAAVPGRGTKSRESKAAARRKRLAPFRSYNAWPGGGGPYE